MEEGVWKGNLLILVSKFQGFFCFFQIFPDFSKPRYFFFFWKRNLGLNSLRTVQHKIKQSASRFTFDLFIHTFSWIPNQPSCSISLKNNPNFYAQPSPFLQKLPFSKATATNFIIPPSFFSFSASVCSTFQDNTTVGFSRCVTR